jgi:predicted small lipoprotein YifL
MKKIFAMIITLSLVLVLSLLAACGGKGNSGGSTTTPPANSNTPSTSQGGNDTTSNGELYAISDDQIIAYEVSLADFTQTVIEGDTRAEMIAAIPAEMKKGIGKLQSAGVQENNATGDGYILSFIFTEASVEDYRKLCEYYKSLGGTITAELPDKQLESDYSWGRLSDCTYEVLQGKTIGVSFTTK